MHLEPTKVIIIIIHLFGESRTVSLDISKAFDRVWHQALVHKLMAFGLNNSLAKINQWGLESILMPARLKAVY